MVDELQAARPGQYDYINSFSIDPVTGELGSRANPQSTPMGTDLGGMYAATKAYVPNENSTQDDAMAAARASYNGTGRTNPAQTGGSNFFGGLKDFVTDATDGGGMNGEGGKHKGLGIYSGIANVLGGKY